VAGGVTASLVVGLAQPANAANPPVTFTGISKPNRVDGFTGGAFPMNKWRISDIKTESGAMTSVQYMPTQCSSTSKPADPAANTMRVTSPEPVP